jgi:hypothetical protein
MIGRTPYAVGYLGGSFQTDADKAGLITAMLENQDGKFLLPSTATISAAAAVLTPPAELLADPFLDAYGLEVFESIQKMRNGAANLPNRQ